MSNKLIFFILLVLFSSVVIAGCSSSEKDDFSLSQVFSGNRLLPAVVSRIYIEEIFDGDISAAVKESFTSSLRKKINRNEKLFLVSSAEKSEVILRIRLTGYSLRILEYSSTGDPVLKKLRLDGYVWLVDTSTGDEKIRNRFVESDLVYSDKKQPLISDFSALNILSEQLADRIVSVLITGWYDVKNK